MAKKKLCIVTATVCVFLTVLLSIQAFAASAKDKIRIGWVTSLSGVNAPV